MRRQQLGWWHLLLVLLAVWAADGKSVAGRYTYTGPGVQYLDNFGCAIGACKWEISARLVSSGASSLPRKGNAPPKTGGRRAADVATVKIRIVLDDTWDSPEMARRPSCQNSVSARVSRIMPLPLDGSWSTVVKGELTQYARPHHWYWVFDDCLDNVRSSLDRSEGGEHYGSPTIEWRLVTKQFNDSHLSYELFGTPKIILAHVIAYAGMLAYVVRLSRNGKTSRGRVHRMMQLLLACLMLQLVSAFVHLTHIWAYAKDGKGWESVDATAEVASFAAQVALSAVLVVVAAGYSLNVPDAPRVEGIAWKIASFVAFVHFLLVLFDRWTRDPRDAYVGTAGIVGIVISIVRLMIWGIFIAIGMFTMGRPTTPQQVRQFLRMFLLAGSIYFTAYPILFVVIHFCHPYLQSRVLNNGIFGMQLLSIGALATLFSSNAGGYFKVSEMAQSYLPGGYMSPTGMYRLD